jgi:hypothetical protein
LNPKSLFPNFEKQQPEFQLIIDRGLTPANLAQARPVSEYFFPRTNFQKAFIWVNEKPKPRFPKRRRGLGLKNKNFSLRENFFEFD